MTPRGPCMERKSIILAAGISIVAVHAVFLYIAISDGRKARKLKGCMSNKVRCRKLVERYPFLWIQRECASSTATPAVRYGKDGRRRLMSTAPHGEEIPWDPSEAWGENPRGRVLLSRDVLLAVLSLLDRKDTLSCSAVSVAFRQIATDDRLWRTYVKVDVAKMLCDQHLQSGRERPSGFSTSYLLQAGLGRVIDMVYSRLPRAYFDLYPRFPPTRERPAPWRGDKSWHRLRLTMTWVQYLRQAPGLPRNNVENGVGSRARPGLGKSRAAMEMYSVVNYFPEQMMSFASFLFWACCSDYWDELVGTSPRDQEEEEEEEEEEEAQAAAEPEAVAVPVWADMRAVLDGYVRLYEGRKFVVLQGNMGFLLQDLHPGGTVGVSAQGVQKHHPQPEHQHGENETPRKRELRIPCTHGTFAENLVSPVPQLKEWPYRRQMSMDGFLSEFGRVEKPPR